MVKNIDHKLQKYSWKLISGLSFFFAVIVTMIMGYNSIVNWLMDEKEVPLRHVVISGEQVHTTKEEITKQVMTQGLGSFFNVDVNAVQQRIESLPWVYRVSVRKKWPDILNVHVTEQQSAALWNNEVLLNEQGDIFSATLDSLGDDETLPKLFGPQGSETDALQGYRDLNSLLSINGFAVDELTLSARFSWQLTLKNGVLLELGREETVKRVQRFIDLYSVISKANPAPVVSVDLRYDTGMAVRWAQQSKGEKNS
jgi:cell division protein FtsQ